MKYGAVAKMCSDQAKRNIVGERNGQHGVAQSGTGLQLRNIYAISSSVPRPVKPHLT